jgi:hypothetical protein
MEVKETGEFYEIFRIPLRKVFIEICTDNSEPSFKHN